MAGVFGVPVFSLKGQRSGLYGYAVQWFSSLCLYSGWQHIMLALGRRLRLLFLVWMWLLLWA